jgi:hypothetical protein
LTALDENNQKVADTSVVAAYNNIKKEAESVT